MCSALNQALPLVTSYRAHGIGVHYHTIALLHPGNDVVCLFIISLFLFLPSFLPDKQTPTQIPFLLLSHLFPTDYTFLFSVPARFPRSEDICWSKRQSSSLPPENFPQEWILEILYLLYPFQGFAAGRHIFRAQLFLIDSPVRHSFGNQYQTRSEAFILNLESLISNMRFWWWKVNLRGKLVFARQPITLFPTHYHQIGFHLWAGNFFPQTFPFFKIQCENNMEAIDRTIKEYSGNFLLERTFL